MDIDDAMRDESRDRREGTDRKETLNQSSHSRFNYRYAFRYTYCSSWCNILQLLLTLKQKEYLHSCMICTTLNTNIMKREKDLVGNEFKIEFLLTPSISVIASSNSLS